MEIPTAEAVGRGHEAFALHEPRDAMYRVASFLVAHFWGRPAEMADGLGVLLLTWNQAFYRYGSFDFSKLEHCITKNMATLESYRAKSILAYTAEDAPHVQDLFQEFLRALTRADGKSKARQSPVAVAKALHLLAPCFFPLWDKKIALAYRCDYSQRAKEKYTDFMRVSQAIARTIQAGITLPAATSLLILIDEYNYSKYTKSWV